MCIRDSLSSVKKPRTKKPFVSAMMYVRGMRGTTAWLALFWALFGPLFGLGDGFVFVAFCRKRPSRFSSKNPPE